MFYRGSGSRREQGMGMGLAVVKSIAELHLWSIDAVSPASLGGACFRITIPVEKHTD
jgi:signal transduction histidine kinase